MQYKKADFRLVCASHKNLPEMVKNGEFREDLYYRIAAFPVELPSLKDRKEDIALLANHFLSHSSFAQKKLTEKALIQLTHYHFPGNIRELKNLIERAAIIADDEWIDEVISTVEFPVDAQAVIAQHSSPEIKPLAQIEAEYLATLIDQSGKTVEQLAVELGVSSRTLHRKLKKFNLSVSKKA
jgi:DNA-binding NtrC family response regulator